jgi:hypothetical protein
MSSIETAWLLSTVRSRFNRSAFDVSICSSVRRCSARAEFQDLVFVGSSGIQLGNHAIIGKHQDAIPDLQDFVDVARD